MRCLRFGRSLVFRSGWPRWSSAVLWRRLMIGGRSLHRRGLVLRRRTFRLDLVLWRGWALRSCSSWFGVGGLGWSRLMPVWLLGGRLPTILRANTRRRSGIGTLLNSAVLRLSGLIAHRRRCNRPHIVICRDRTADGHVGGTAMIDGRELSSIGAGETLILQLCAHRGSMRFMERRQFRGPRSRLDAA